MRLRVIGTTASQLRVELTEYLGCTTCRDRP
jgi:hypothetical protein